MISESTLTNVFEMFVQRLNTIETSIETINKLMIYDARYKTNHIIHGCVFNYPFEIENYKLDKKKYAYINIRLTERGDFNSLYDILMSIFDCTFINLKALTEKQAKLREHLKKFIFQHYPQVLKTLVSISALNDKHLTPSFHKITSLYSNILEHILAHYVKINTFDTFNHVQDSLSIMFSSQAEPLYVDQIIDQVLSKLASEFDYKMHDILDIKIVGLSKELFDITKFYDINSGCADIDKQRAQIIEHIAKIPTGKRIEIRKNIIEHAKERQILPIFANKKEMSFLCDSLEPETTIIDQSFILIMPGAVTN
jgi:hypothetical protein